MKQRKRTSRMFALLLCLILAFSISGNMTFAAPEKDGLCEHHPEHTESCGYQQAREEKPCGHVHDENCGYQENNPEAVCNHIHDENCGYAEAVAESPCTFVCSQCGAKAVPLNDANDNFSKGRSITYYAAASDNEYFGTVSDYKDNGALLSSWNKTFDEGKIFYSEKQVSGENTQPYCSFLYQQKDIDWGDGAENTHCLTKTYNFAVPDNEVVAENYEENAIVMPFNGKGNAFFGLRFVAYNTEPDGSGTWYRCGQTLPEDVTELYAQYCSALQLAGQITNLAKEAKAGIELNGTDTAYTAEDPYAVTVTDGKLSEDSLYYTAHLNMGETASRMSWARMDKMDLSIENTYVELTVNFDPRLNLFPDGDTFTFQYTGGFSPYQNGKLLSPDEGTVCTYTVSVNKNNMPNNVLKLKLGLKSTGFEAPDLTLKQFSEMSLTVSGQKGARAVIPEELADKAADSGVTDETDESFIKTDGQVFIQVKPDGYSSQKATIDIAPVYAQLQKAETVTLTPQDMVAYTGGDSMSGDSFPTVRYQIDTPEGVEPEDITFSANGKTCKPEQSGSYYILSSVENTFTSESIAAAENDAQAGVYDIGIEDEASLSASSSGTPFNVEIADEGTLTVRNVSAPENVIDGTADVAQPIVTDSEDVNTDDGIGIAMLPQDTKFYTNGNEDLGLLGDDDSEHPQISLLFDDIIPGEQGEDTKELLLSRAKDEGYSIEDENTQFKYLDLINENDGNAWISADNGSTITIYWPCPEEIEPDEMKVQVLHFKGLHREYRGDIENQVENCEVETIDAKIEDGNVVFELEGNQTEGSFSPFAVHWTKDTSQTVTDKTEQPGGTTSDKNSSDDSSAKTGDTQNISLWLILLIISCLGITVLLLSMRNKNGSSGHYR